MMLRTGAYLASLITFTFGLTACQEAPTDVAAQIPGLSGIRIVRAGTYFSLAVGNDGTLWAWGDNTYGQLGVASNDTCGEAATPCTKEPVKVPFPNTHVLEIAAGYRHALATGQDQTSRQNSLWAWGDNSFGQLGDGTLTSRPTPVMIDAGAQGGVDAGAWHSLFWGIDGTLAEWGSHLIFTTEPSPCVLAPEPGNIRCNLAPTLVPGVTVRSAAAGSTHTLSNSRRGAEPQVCGWGFNDFGEAGTSRGPIVQPLCRPFPVEVVRLSGGDGFSVALEADGTALTWGLNDRRQLGFIDALDLCWSRPCSLEPRAVTDPTGAEISWRLIDAGGAHVLGISSTGAVMAWGSDQFGQVGSPAVSGGGGTLMHRVQTDASEALANIKWVSAGATHSLAVADDGTVWSWGDNFFGQLGR
jgi:alpha-tubulin suppressor-like RCC1 family protein